MTINMKDIARISGVAVATVSRVLNNSGYVSDATRKKVLDVVNEYRYTPNNAARSLKISSTNRVGLLVKGTDNPFFQRMMREIERGLAMRGYKLLIQDVGGKNEMEAAIQLVQDNNLCGLILMGGYFVYSKEDFARLGAPCVLLTVRAAVDVDPALYSSVTVDDEQEGFRAVDSLIQMGHTRIGFLYHFAYEENTPNSLRYRGYLHALQQHGIPFDHSLVAGEDESRAAVFSEGGFRTGFRMTQQLMAKNPDMTAIFAFSDVLAVGAAKAVLTAGKRIPEDMSIIGFDGIDAAEFFHPSLDTVYQPATEMAMSCVSLLSDMIGGQDGRHMICPCTLLRRGSTQFRDKN